MEKGPNPFSGHPYRREISSEEREDIEAQRNLDRFRRIFRTIQQKEELNSDDAEYARTLSSLWEPVDDFTDRWDREEYEELTSDRLMSIGLTENIYAKLLQKIPRNEQEAFRTITRARKI